MISDQEILEKYKENFVVGFKKGKAEGKVEQETEIAKAMLLDGDSAEKIAEITGLSITEIKKLKY